MEICETSSMVLNILERSQGKKQHLGWCGVHCVIITSIQDLSCSLLLCSLFLNVFFSYSVFIFNNLENI